MKYFKRLLRKGVFCHIALHKMAEISNWHTGLIEYSIQKGLIQYTFIYQRNKAANFRENRWNESAVTRVERNKPQ